MTEYPPVAVEPDPVFRGLFCKRPAASVIAVANFDELQQ